MFSKFSVGKFKWKNKNKLFDEQISPMQLKKIVEMTIKRIIFHFKSGKQSRTE